MKSIFYVQLSLYILMIYCVIMYLHYDRRIKEAEQKEKNDLDRTLILNPNYYLASFYVNGDETPICLNHFVGYDVIECQDSGLIKIRFTSIEYFINNILLKDIYKFHIVKREADNT